MPDFIFEFYCSVILLLCYVHFLSEPVVFSENIFYRYDICSHTTLQNIMRYFCSFLVVFSLLMIGIFPALADTDAQPVRILAFGDSLTAGYGLAHHESFPAVLEKRLRDLGFDATVINGGVSGDTAATGQARLDWSLRDQPDIVIVALGANDALRGIEPAKTATHLNKILTRIKKSGARILLAGMLAPRNLDDAYIQAFDSVFPSLARQHDVPFYPFFLEGVAFDPELNLSDGLHPNPRGIARMVQGILPTLTPLLNR